MSGRGLLLLVAAAVALGPATPATAADAGDAGLSAVVHRTEHGIAHVTADDDAGLGFGYGRVAAEDHLCLLAEAYVTVAGERSRWFGPDGQFVFHANEARHSNLESDLFYRQILAEGRVEELLSTPPPVGVRPEAQRLITGYVAGYNAYLRDTPRAQLDPRCRDAGWVRPITEELAYARLFQLASLAGGGLAITGVGKAQPPLPGAPPPASSPAGWSTALGELGERLGLGGTGSNAIALGRQATTSGAGMVLANPHLPWKGDYRLHHVHLTIPGELDVSGATFIGVPLVLIGHTRDVAWSHTTSSAFRFTPFEVRLVPGSPTTYLVDGEPRAMTSRRITVPVKRPDGSVGEVERTLWSTEYGPVLTELLGLPLFPWTPVSAYAFADANAANLRYLNHFYEVDRARSVQDVDAAIRRHQGLPWATTVAADARGRTLFADASVTPNVPDAKAHACNTALGVAAFALLRLPVLDGSRSACRWGTDPDAVVPGIFGPGNLPFLQRDDYVSNSNDSHWLTNPEQPLEGFARIVGSERTERSLRTRLGLRMIQEGRPFDLAGLQALQFNERNGAAELMRDALVGLCRSLPVLVGTTGPVEKGEACDVLAAWDGRDHVDSRGVLLFRRFAERALPPLIPGDNAVGGGAPAPLTWLDAFDPSDPVGTPRRLNVANPQVVRALGDAVADLRAAGIPLGARLGEHQADVRDGERIPLGGGPGRLGVFDALNVKWVPGQGWPEVPHGATFLMATELRGDCPPTRTLVAYSQSSRPGSRWHADQTRMLARREWVTERFCAADVLASPELAATRAGCLPATAGHDRGRLAWLAPGTAARRALALAGRPDRRGRRAWRWCVAGGGHVRVALVGSGRRRVGLVGSSSRAHRVAGARPGTRLRGRAWRRVRGGLRVRRAARGRLAVAGVHRGRVRWVGLASGRTSRLPVLARRARLR